MVPEPHRKKLNSTNVATLLAWCKCQNSQTAQKCLRESAKGDLVSLGRESKRVSRTVQTLFRTRRNPPKHSFAPCKKTVFGTHTLEARKHHSHSPLIRKRGGVQKSIGNKVPWKTGVLIYLHVASRPLISLQKEAVLSPCNFATTHLTACILSFYLP